MDDKTAEIVNQQYEQYPYPYREAEHEKERLLSPGMSDLSLVNSLGFKGKADISKFRVLIAGGGTGDAVIFLAEQLKTFSEAEVVYCDLSEASMKIAQERANVRGLDNIVWLNKSLFDLSEYINYFDYINCSGVLHHLEDPASGLKFLNNLLKPNGIIAIMVYAQIGRTAVYQIQDLIKLVASDKKDLKEKIDIAKNIMQTLPDTNWWHHSKEYITDYPLGGDAGIVDLLLHSQDRAYSISQLYELIAQADLNLVDFIMPNRYELLPETHGISGELLSLVKGFPKQKQQAIVELFSGNIIKHSCFLSKKDNKDTKADPSDINAIPFFYGMMRDGVELADSIDKSNFITVTATLNKYYKVTFNVGRYTTKILRSIDGEKSIKDIVSEIVAANSNSVSEEEVLDEFIELFNSMNAVDVILLKYSHPD